MTRLLLSAACLVCVAGHDLSTDYTETRTLRIEASTTVEMETTSSSIEIDGEARDFGGRGGQSSTTVRRAVQIDTFLEHEDGCLIDFYVDFEFRSVILQKVIGALFHEAVRRMVAAFEARARDIYGSPGETAMSTVRAEPKGS